MESPGRVKSSFQRPASASRPHWLGFLIVWFACCGGAFAQPAQELTVTPMYGQPYPPDRLLPLRIELRNHGSAPVDGAVLIAAQSPAAAHLRVPVQVPPNAHVTLTAYGYLPVQPLSQPAAAAEGTGVVPVAIAEWRGADGAQLARNEVLARPMGAGEAQAEVAVRPASLLLAVTGTDREQSGESLLVQPFARFLAAGVPYPIEVGEAGAADLPRHRAGYDAVRAVILAATPPDSLDDGQRQALLDFLLGGGTLVLSAPVDEVDGTWLAPYMPVDIIGQREAAQIVPTDATATTAPPLKFREPIIISEAVDAGGDVLLRDRSYVHAAFRTVGMGRVVFTSFPVNALEPSDARVETLWRALLDLDGAGGEPGGGVALAGERDSLLQAMIGTPAAPWAHAAAVAGAYLLVLTLAQLLVPGARRPAAFAFTTALGVVTCVALMGFTALRRDGSTTPTAARLATVQLGADGGGVRNEFWAFLGSSDATLSLSADLRAVLRPAITRADDPPTLNQLPFATPDAGVHAGRIDRVWQASEPVGADQAMLATAQFTPQGLRVEIDNRTGESLTAPLLVWNGNYYRLPPVPTGSSDALLGEKNPPGDFTNVAVITGEEATLRGRIVKAARSLHMDAPPALLGWLDPAASGLGEPIVRFSTQPQPVRPGAAAGATTDPRQRARRHDFDSAGFHDLHRRRRRRRLLRRGTP